MMRRKINKKYFQEGDMVEFHKGGIGIVTYADKFSCTVKWNDGKLRGNPANSTNAKNNYSISLPSINLSPKFNPIIREPMTLQNIKKD